MPGRAGRGSFERGRYGPQPKYLSLKPPLLPFSPPKLTNNPFYLLGRNLFQGDTLNISQFVPSKTVNPPLTTKPSSPLLNSNGLDCNNGNSTKIPVQNPQDSQTTKISTREAFIQFYVRQKKTQDL